MSTPVVEIHGLGKRYALGERDYAYTTLRDTMANAILNRGRRREREELWALREVDLTVGDGEILGIVGRNGAGKTTLLKILTRITRPTTGSARTRGRVGALLEVGTGFHPELTGRENVYLNGAILGLAKRDITDRFDEIVEFAGVERFIDTPLKRYSSGMQLRLAFAVAAHLEPEVIVVDEVLAVGDVEFRRKCLGKMSELTETGRTVLFVSHDLGALGKLCTRAIWIDQGHVVADGPTREVLQDYLGAIAERSHRVDFTRELDAPVQLRSVEVSSSGENSGRAPIRGEPVDVRFLLDVREAAAGLDASVNVIAEDGTFVLSEAWSDTGKPMVPVGREGEYEVTLKVPPILASGTYRIRLWLGTPHENFMGDHVLSFEVQPRHDDSAESVSRIRAVQPEVEWELRQTGGA